MKATICRIVGESSTAKTVFGMTHSLITLMIWRYLKQGDIRIVCWGSGLRRRRKLSIRGLMKQDSLSSMV